MIEPNNLHTNQLQQQQQTLAHLLASSSGKHPSKWAACHLLGGLLLHKNLLLSRIISANQQVFQVFYFFIQLLFPN